MFLGIDVGTGSSKGVLVDDGRIVAQHVVKHETSTPHPGWFEHDANGVWWADVVEICREVTALGPAEVVCVSGIGPAVVPADGNDQPLRPAILYGIDTRATEQIERRTAELGAETILSVCGNYLSSQAIGPKLDWIADHEPDVWARTKRFYEAPNWIVQKLTGEYVLDLYSASGSDPLFDLAGGTWWEPGWAGMEHIERPRLAWPGEIVGTVHAAAAAQTGLALGTPVLAGTIDAIAEAYSVNYRSESDTMLMYGSTMFIVEAVREPAVHPGLWALYGVSPGLYTAAAGMSTAGLITDWLADRLGKPYGELSAAAAAVPPGSNGLLLLPYFAGERTPIFDPAARGTWIGLTTAHDVGHLYRSALEAVGFGVRHNLEALVSAGAPEPNLIAVGGGTQDRLWLQIVSDVTGRPQKVPSVTVGASFGDAMLAAEAVGVDVSGWNPVREVVEPNPANRGRYDDMFSWYLAAYPALRDVMHGLADLN